MDVVKTVVFSCFRACVVVKIKSLFFRCLNCNRHSFYSPCDRTDIFIYLRLWTVANTVIIKWFNDDSYRIWCQKNVEVFFYAKLRIIHKLTARRRHAASTVSNHLYCPRVPNVKRNFHRELFFHKTYNFFWTGSRAVAFWTLESWPLQVTGQSSSNFLIFIISISCYLLFYSSQTTYSSSAFSLSPLP